MFETLYNNFKFMIFENDGFVELRHIEYFVRMFQERRLDCSVLINGQNGFGKSMLMLAIMKQLDPNSIGNPDQILYAYHTTRDFLMKIKKLRKCPLAVDEMGIFFSYRLSNTTEQQALFSYIEVARQNAIATIAASRNIFTLNNNYRNSKVCMVLWILDRYDAEGQKFPEIPGIDKKYMRPVVGDTGKERSVIACFVGNPIQEGEDRFSLEQLQYCKNWSEWRIKAERLPSFRGYMIMDDIDAYITHAELKEYETAKQKGMDESMNRLIDRLERKENKQSGIANKPSGSDDDIRNAAIQEAERKWKLNEEIKSVLRAKTIEKMKQQGGIMRKAPKEPPPSND